MAENKADEYKEIGGTGMRAADFSSAALLIYSRFNAILITNPFGRAIRFVFGSNWRSRYPLDEPPLGLSKGIFFSCCLLCILFRFKYHCLYKYNF